MAAVSTAAATSLPKREFKSVSSCYPGYRLVSPLGKGAYGSVFKACRLPVADKKQGGDVPPSRECDNKENRGGGGYAIKIGTQLDVNDTIAALLEQQALKRLQGEHYINSLGEARRLVPQVYYANTNCEGQSVLIMEEYQIDAMTFGKLQYDAALADIANLPRFPQFTDFKSTKTNMLFTADQFEDLFRIAARLDEIGFIHGDLSLSQFLMRPSISVVDRVTTGRVPLFPWTDKLRKLPVPIRSDIVIGDFGLPRTWGWMNSFGCPAPTDATRSVRGWNKLGRNVADYFNQWQLAAWIAFPSHNVLVQDPVTGDFLTFTGIEGIPQWWMDLINERCPTVAKNILPNIPPRESPEQYAAQLGVSPFEVGPIIEATLPSTTFKVRVTPVESPTFPTDTRLSFYDLMVALAKSPDRLMGYVDEYLDIGASR